MLTRILDRLFEKWEPHYYRHAFDRALDAGEPVDLGGSPSVRVEVGPHGGILGPGKGPEIPGYLLNPGSQTYGTGGVCRCGCMPSKGKRNKVYGPGPTR